VRKSEIITRLESIPGDPEVFLWELADIEEDVRYKASKWDSFNKIIGEHHDDIKGWDFHSIGELAAKTFGWL
jgi:hypothetical protein